MLKVRKITGFTLIELVLVIIIIGIVASIASRSMVRVFTNANYNSTIAELEILAEAMVGNPDIVANNIRTNYGYVGDCGQFPPTLDDLVTNVSNVDGWDGPYIDIGFSDDTDYYKADAWNNPYIYTLPSNPDEAPTIMTPADGDTLIREISATINSVINNTITILLLNEDGVTVDGTNGQVQIEYVESWHDFTYSSQSGFQISTVPIGIFQIRAMTSGDTTYKSVAVGPDNTTTSQPMEMMVYSSWGDINLVSGSVSIEGTCLDQMYFDVNNTGTVTFEIDQIGFYYYQLANDCWNCEHPYLASFSSYSTEYWAWNTNGRSALIDSGAIITLDEELPIYGGENTLGPFTFEDASDGTGNCINIQGTYFTIKFFSNISPTKTIAFNGPGSCTTPVLSQSGTVTWDSDEINITIENSGILTATFSSIDITTDISAATAYLASVQFDGSTFWAAPGDASCPGLTRPRIDGNNTGTANFVACTGYSAPSITGNDSQTLTFNIEQDATGTTDVPLGSSDYIILDFYFDCPENHSQSISFSLP